MNVYWLFVVVELSINRVSHRSRCSANSQDDNKTETRLDLPPGKPSWILGAKLALKRPEVSL